MHAGDLDHTEPLTALDGCCCAAPYADDDMVLLEDAAAAGSGPGS